jgi:hypothetical protein
MLFTNLKHWGFRGYRGRNVFLEVKLNAPYTANQHHQLKE